MTRFTYGLVSYRQAAKCVAANGVKAEQKEIRVVKATGNTSERDGGLSVEAKLSV